MPVRDQDLEAYLEHNISQLKASTDGLRHCLEETALGGYRASYAVWYPMDDIKYTRAATTIENWVRGKIIEGLT